MAVELTTPITTPAVAEKVFNEIWLSSLRIQAIPDKCIVDATIQPCRTVDGVKELSPNKQVLHVANLWADISQDELAAMVQVVSLIKARLGV